MAGQRSLVSEVTKSRPVKEPVCSGQVTAGELRTHADLKGPSGHSYRHVEGMNVEPLISSNTLINTTHCLCLPESPEHLLINK